jgi:hypothetical protein
MNFDDVRVIAMRTAEGERFAALWTEIPASPQGELRMGRTVDRDRNPLLERVGACVMQPETDLSRRLARLGMSADAIEQRFETARTWITTVAVTDLSEL